MFRSKPRNRLPEYPLQGLKIIAVQLAKQHTHFCPSANVLFIDLFIPSFICSPSLCRNHSIHLSLNQNNTRKRTVPCRQCHGSLQSGAGGARWAAKGMSRGNALRAPAEQGKSRKRRRLVISWGSQRAGCAKGSLTSGTKPLRAGEGRSHTEKPVMLEPRTRGLLEIPQFGSHQVFPGEGVFSGTDKLQSIFIFQRV